MIDYLSKYVELKPLNSTNAQSVITVMKSIYATHGIPEDLVSDGGPPFNSNLMSKFFREWGIKHHVTPPHFPRANGQIERAVQRVKNSLTKAAEEGKDLRGGGGVFRRNRFHIRQDYTEDDNPCWSRTVEDLFNSDATEISRTPSDSADSQVNASPKTNRSNINQRLQVPIENYREQSNPVFEFRFNCYKSGVIANLEVSIDKGQAEKIPQNVSVNPYH
ncbi:retrovirus-related Pol polyprotein from transposon 17.6 [Trichonephila clavata]|uniref:Retrovirus-related Pol polyprotein from transposon 17.6 n=1 Tax=Trichonephila clavata TaxID=2740835 RepID=A0A8X6F4X6_TRICU|nr:retrovirus-related Pol polyprotein from transposon 17.6 [Trichonephila clavata]